MFVLIIFILKKWQGALLDPFVPDDIEPEVLQAAVQIDRSVVPAFVYRLHEGVWRKTACFEGLLRCRLV